MGKEGFMKPRLLAMELWGLGDLAIATPFLQAAVEKYEVTLLARPFAQELRPHFWPEVEVLPFTAPWTAFHGKYQLWRWPWREIFRLRRQLRSRQFDFAVSARWDPRDHLALKWSGARERLGFPRLKSSRYLTQALNRPSPLAHRYESWRVAGEALGLNLPPRTTVFASSKRRPPVVLVHSGARLPLRVWPLENFREIIRRLRDQKFTVQIACDPDQSRSVADYRRSPGLPALGHRVGGIAQRGGCFYRQRFRSRSSRGGVWRADLHALRSATARMVRPAASGGGSHGRQGLSLQALCGLLPLCQAVLPARHHAGRGVAADRGLCETKKSLSRPR